MSNKPKCKRCGTGMFCIPEINEDHFDLAREGADFVWIIASKGGNPVSVACLTAALLIKRAADWLGIPHDAQRAMAAHYIQVVHEIIIARRRESELDKARN